MHGAWIERHGLEPSGPQGGFRGRRGLGARGRFGRRRMGVWRDPRRGDGALRNRNYEYEAIVQAFVALGFEVISEARTHVVQGEEYARGIADQIRQLLEKGVPPENITVIGHSKGGGMTLVVSSLLGEPKINFVVMAGCGKEGAKFRESYDKLLDQSASSLQGRILSIYDSSDSEAGTCQEAFHKASNVITQEIVLHTGRGHQLFDSPDPRWVNEVVKWAGL